MTYQAPPGTYDLLPERAQVFNSIRQSAFELFGRYGYLPIETPVFEQLDVFVRGIGDATDVIGKEMYLVLSQHALAKLAQGGKAPEVSSILALRPEQTAGVARAVVQHQLASPGGAPVKLVYAGPMFRHEHPQKGRYREFRQIGVECLGAAEPSADAEVIIMLMRFFAELGIPRDRMRLLLNSMGDDSCRPAYRQQIQDYILAHAGDLCAECVRRADSNPLRAFDCKNPGCQTIMADAPLIADVLCDECRTHYDAVRAYLDAADIDYEEAPRLVRGLDYYTRTVFEVQVTEGLGAQNAIGGGGRYDRLIEDFGGKPTPGLGFAVGFERIWLVLESLEALKSANFELGAPRVFLATVENAARPLAFELARQLRDAGISAELDHQARSLKSQFKLADRLKAAFVAILGPDELADGKLTLRDMATREESLLALTDIVERLRA
ncbi:MAG: histidine--tRNA ligase [Coriobacteriales bacterium]|jgi:histidyl-tRNA synthetase|nr:histidine--tRNA ligase [Coriobacteriales bacterium]